MAGARGYELAILRVRDGERADSTVVTRVTVPGDARSFTPRLDQCLERGGRYAWSVAATTGNGSGQLAWAPTHFFDVASAPSIDELEDALATVQRYLSAQRAESPARFASAPEGAPTRSTQGSGSDDGGTEYTSRRGVSRHELASADASRGFLPGALTASTVTRTLSEGTALTLGDASLTVSEQIHLAEGSDFFKAGYAFLWDDDTGHNTALGRRALAAAAIGGASQNTAIGWEALRNNDGSAAGPDGSFNTGVGYRALYANDLGRANTATGFRALQSNTFGVSNTATGSTALRTNVSGYHNTAIGASALYSATEDGSTAIGANALFGNTTGAHNIGVGFGAGSANTTGSYSIFIGNQGSAADHHTIKIGTALVQTTAFLAGDLGLGFSSGTPENRLHVQESINGDASNPGEHVAQIENTNTGNSADVLALKVARDHSGATPIPDSQNFITFLDANSILGEIQGTGTGGVEFVSAGADFAEWLPRLDAAEPLGPGDVVGLHGGALSKRTDGAARVFVVSTAPIVTGNDPGEELHSAYARVAFVGQAPVKVRGPVRAGDLLVASGRGDGVAIARSPEELSPADWPALVGRALENPEGVDPSGTRLVRALVGLDSALAPAASRALERALARLEHRMDRLEKGSGPSETAASAERAPTRRR